MGVIPILQGSDIGGPSVWIGLLGAVINDDVVGGGQPHRVF